MIRTTVILAFAVSCLVGCDGPIQLAAVKQANVPFSRHYAPPDPKEIAANPCKYHDVARCIATCQAGEVSACNSLGILFEFGPEGSDGSALASGFYARACDSNYAPGCTNLGWLYSLGHGVPHDPQQAMALFTRAYESSRLACRRGDASGCLMAGQARLEGRGVEADQGDALAYFQQACAGGEAKGCEYVSTLR